MNNNLENIEELIGKFLSGEITIEELHQLDNWRKSERSHEIIFNEYVQSWNIVDSTLVADKLDIEVEWESQKNKVFNNQKNKKLSIRSYLRIAAVIFLIAASSIFTYKYFGLFESVKSKEQITEVNLSDGTDVVLNTDSKIKYASKFSEKERRIKLSGEGYFEVTKDSTRPFIVETDKVIVMVLGTTFNVDENNVENYTEVLVEEGVVKVNSKFHLNQEVLLKAGESARFFYQSGEFKRYADVDENSIAWKTGILKFRNKKLSYIVKKLNKTYQSNIVIASNDIADCRMTSVFENQDLNSILNVLKATLDIDVKMIRGQIVLTGKGCK